MSIRTLLPLLLAIAVAVGSYAWANWDGPSALTGTDDQAVAVVEHMDPDYRPWAKSLWAPPDDAMESLLFVLQAGLGAGVLGYCLGYLHGRRRGRGQ